MNSNPNTPVAGLVERLTEVAQELRKSVLPTSFIAEADIRISEAASHIEQLEADKRALVADLREIETESGFIGQSSDAYAAEKGLRIQRIVRKALATISNPTSVKDERTGTE